MWRRRDWKSVQLEREETSPQPPRPGIHASMSYFRNALAPSSSEGISNTLQHREPGVNRNVELLT